MGTPWQQPTVGSVMCLPIAFSAWRPCTDAGVDPAAAVVSTVARGATTYDQQSGWSLAHPVGAGINMTFVDVRLDLPHWSMLHPSGGPFGFGFTFEWFGSVNSAAAKLCLFWAWKICPHGVDNAAIAWNVVSAYQNAVVTEYVSVPVDSGLLSLPRGEAGGCLRLRVGRRANEGADIDAYAGNAVFAGAMAYVVTN